jgi:hypothetical protein
MSWTRPQQVALVLTIIIGALAGMAFPLPTDTEPYERITYFPALPFANSDGDP